MQSHMLLFRLAVAERRRRLEARRALRGDLQLIDAARSSAPPLEGPQSSLSLMTRALAKSPAAGVGAFAAVLGLFGDF